MKNLNREEEGSRATTDRSPLSSARPIAIAPPTPREIADRLARPFEPGRRVDPTTRREHDERIVAALRPARRHLAAELVDGLRQLRPLAEHLEEAGGLIKAHGGEAADLPAGWLDQIVAVLDRIAKTGA